MALVVPFGHGGPSGPGGPRGPGGPTGPGTPGLTEKKKALSKLLY